MARLPTVPIKPYQVDAELVSAPATRIYLDELRTFLIDVVNTQERLNTQMLNDYQRKANPLEPPEAGSAQLNTSTALYIAGATGRVLYVRNASGGGELAFSDGSSWKLIRTKTNI